MTKAKRLLKDLQNHDSKVIIDLSKYITEKDRLIKCSKRKSSSSFYTEVVQPFLNYYDWLLQYYLDEYSLEEHLIEYLSLLMRDLPYNDLQKTKVVDHILNSPIWEDGMIKPLKLRFYEEILVGIATIVSNLNDSRMAQPLIKSLLYWSEHEDYQMGDFTVGDTREVFKAIRNSNLDSAKELVSKLISDINLSEKGEIPPIVLLSNIGALGGNEVVKLLQNWLKENPESYLATNIAYSMLEHLILRRNLERLKVWVEDYSDWREFHRLILKVITKYDEEIRRELIETIGGMDSPYIVETLRNLGKKEKNEEISNLIRKNVANMEKRLEEEGYKPFLQS